jgi:TPR repeat protein
MPRDHARAARHFERAHRAGIPHGTVGLAKMLMSGEGVAKNASKALEYYEDAAEKGDREALNGLGYLAFHGLGGMEQNLSKAFE